MTLKIVPVFHKEANAFVKRLHRHHKPTTGMILSVGVTDDERLCGVAIAGRPVAPAFQDGRTIEINRVCTDGTPNACSMLYSAVRKAARALGYERIITYTLPEEGGASLRAAGFVFDGEAGGPARLWHNRPDRKVRPVGEDIVGGKWRWVA